MFYAYNLNIMTCRYDSSLFNYHSTIINQLFNHHFSRFTRNKNTPKELKIDCFPENIRLFSGKRYFFTQKTLDLLPEIPVSEPFIPPSDGYRHPGLQVTDIRVSIKICSYSYENKLYKTRKKDTVFMIA